MKLTNERGVVRAVLPAGFRGSAAGWGVATLALWAATALPIVVGAAVSRLVGAPGAPPELFSGMMLAFAPFAVFGVYLLLWAAGGSEVVERDAATLAVRRRLLGVPMPAREYDLSAVERLRVGPHPYMRAWNPWAPIQGGTIAFDYGAGTFRFGGGLDETEAAELVSMLEEAS